MEKSKKLYRVTLKGMTYSSGGGVIRGISYVVAEDLNEAYGKVRTFLDQNNYGYKSDRELDKIELIADSYEYNNVGHILFL